MAIDGQKADKLRGFLRELSPQARAMLLAELERNEQGGGLPGSDLIIRELRNVGRDDAPAPVPVRSAADRDENAARQFFAFLEPFFVDDEPDRVHEGRLPRAAAATMWEWICRDLLPDDANAYADNAIRLLRAGDQGKAAQAAHAFQDRVAQTIEKTLVASQTDEKARRKLAHQIGTPRALEDVRQLVAILKTRDVLAALAGKLPSKIRNLSDDQIASFTAFVDSTAGKHRQVYTMGLVLLLSRLSAPWQLIRVAIKAADSDQPTRIGETPYAPAVSIVLSDVERLVRELETDLQRGQAMAQPSLLKDIHDAARGLRTELDLSGDTPWGRRLAAIRSQLAVTLRPDIESAPGRVRRMLRVRSNKEIVPGSVLDASDVAETEALLGFVGQCRNYANELAINEMTMRAYSEVQNYLETHVEQLLEGLRTSVKTDRSYRQSQFDAAARFCAKIFGQEYAETLVKAGEVAVANERKVAAKA